MAGFGFLVICILIGYAWLTRRRVKDLEEMVQTLSDHSAELFRRVASLERTRPPAVPVLATAPSPAPQAVPPPPPLLTEPRPQPAAPPLPPPAMATPPPPRPPAPASREPR
ncbi:MAG TPA: hypothetical protein VGR07_08665, partial [Thermoanaerobaculia bacterium]|nr:hypothetical protein [Thermoanaerobaculia bacterium]